MIVVSEPSAETTRRVRTRRSTPAHSRSSAAHNDTPRHADARPISVHTEEIMPGPGRAALVQIGYKPYYPTPPNVDQRPQRSPGHRPSRPPRPWPAFSQPRYISKRSAAQTKHALAGRAGLRDGPTSAEPGSVGWRGVASRRPPRGLPRDSPGARLPSSAGGGEGWCPRGATRLGYARSTGCHTAPSVQNHQWSPEIKKASRHPARHHTGRNGTAPRLAQTVGGLKRP